MSTQYPYATQPPYGENYPTPQPPKRKRHWGRWIVVAIVGLFLLGGLVSLVGSASDQVNKTPIGTLPTTQTFPDLPTVTPSTPAATKAVPAPTKAPVVTKAPPVLTRAQENAIGTAKDYLNVSHFSRSGLISQLEFEDYSKADATFAVNSLHVDYNEQAVGTGQDYLDTQHFSRGGLIEQLEFEGYTKAQATYAADQLGL
jgi:hypothetical protein